MNAPVLELAPGQTAVIGYGSLLSLDSLSRTLKQPYTGPFLQCEVDGWRRSWDVAMPNEAFYFERNGERVYPPRILYLNVRPMAGSRINGVLFALDAEQLAAMHGREWIYEPTVVTAAVRKVQVTGGDALMYVGRPGCRVGPLRDAGEGALRASYLGIVERALGAMEPDFGAQFSASTDPVPEHLVIDDHLDGERPSPWAVAGRGYQAQLEAPNREEALPSPNEP